MIRAYPREPTVDAGGTLTLHVSTDRPRFAVRLYRHGEQLAAMGDPGDPLPGHFVPDGPPDRDWGWPRYDFEIPPDWPSGVYLAQLIDGSGDGAPPSTASATDGQALFVVRNRTKGGSSILYKLSWATYHAYNATGYGSLYSEAVWRRGRHPGFQVTTRRPGGGTGGVVMPDDSEDYYDRKSRRQTFAHWDAPFIAWLERVGYDLDYCTDLDLHREPALLDPYALLLSVGHDEYWSEEMRAAVDRFTARGGNVACFSANLCSYRIHFSEDHTSFTCAKVLPSARESDVWELDLWSRVRPEAQTFGVSYGNGGGWWEGKRQTLGYTVQHAEHWAFAGTGLEEGDLLGADETFPLVGYECDGASYKRRVDGLAIPTYTDGTPDGLCLLGIAELGPGWATARAGAAATMAIFTTQAGGTVFEGATTDWPIVASRNPQVGQITRNVLDRLALRSVRVIGPLPGRSGRMRTRAGETARFHVDVGPLGPVDGFGYRWTVGGAQLTDDGGGCASVAMPAEARPVTVSVTVSEQERQIAFGTTTFIPLTVEEDLGTELLTTLREMVFPGEPSGPLVVAASDPFELNRQLIDDTRLVWLIERAQRLQAATRALQKARRARES